MNADLDRMFATLAKHAKVPERPKESPKTVTVELQWEKPKDAKQTGIYTICKRYTCAKVTLAGQPFYEVYRLAPKSEWYACIAAGLKSFEIAKQVAQRDFERCQQK